MIKHVVCAVSGGVDSAVAALLLRKKGFRVTGVFMRNWDARDEVGRCTIDEDASDAEIICDHLGIKFVEVNFVRQYWNDVFSTLIEGYKEGVTPNPDVLCNKYIKFGHFFKYAMEHLKADAVATGHYARNSAGQYLDELNTSYGSKLLQSADQTKDQTLFLSQISQNALQRTMFPVGGLLKSTVKSLASEAGLETIAKKKESTGICFIGKRHFQDFIEEYIESKRGTFVNIETGSIVGEHEGVHCWTVGQRTHLGGLSTAYFVVARDATTQTITVAPGTNHPALFSDSMITKPPHWVHSCPSNLLPRSTIHCQFRFQHTYSLIGCDVKMHADGSLNIHLSRPIRALTSGQYAVLYDGQECLGSAEITKVGLTVYETISKRLRTVDSDVCSENSILVAEDDIKCHKL